MVGDGRPGEKEVPTLRTVISYNSTSYDVIREGLAEILTAQKPSKTQNCNGDRESQPAQDDGSIRQTVFYNPVQQYNRDLSVLAIRAHAEDLSAVRLSRQKHPEQNVARAEKRGKKRKRGTEQETMKKCRADEEVNSVITSETTGKEPLLPEGPTIEEPIKKDEYMVIGADGEIEDAAVDGSEGHEEHGGKQSAEVKREEAATSNDIEGDAGQIAPGDAKAKALDLPKAPMEPRNNMPPVSTQTYRILDALSATGLRALRYAKEIPLATSITANDLSSPAAASIKINVMHNAVTSKVRVTTSDALEHMYSSISCGRGRMPQAYQVIDLDPYGTAAPFLDAAVQAITDGGLLCVTCTDAGVFASIGYLEKTFSQYGGLPLKGPHAHEAGLRLILHAIATTAARYGISIEPLLSLSIDFYARVFVRIHKSPADVKFLASKTMVVYQCDSGCGSWSTQFLAQARGKEARNGDTFYKFTSALGPSAGKECEHCGFRTHLAGPMWGGPLHNPFFVQRILSMLPELDRNVYQTVPRIEGMLSLALDESLDDPWASIIDSKKQPSPVTEPKKHLTEGPPKTDNCSSSTASTSPIPSGRPVPPLPAHYRPNNHFFIHPHALARALNTTTPSDAAFRGALRHLGYLASRSHTKAGSIVTDAPLTVIWEIMREWARKELKSGKGSKTMKSNTAGAGIMRNDRSRWELQSARQGLKERIEGVDHLEGLKRELEAALYRLSKNNEHSNGAGATDGFVFLGADTTSDNAPDLPSEPTNLSSPPSIKSPDPQLNTLEVNFDEKLGKDPTAIGPGRKKMVRYQENPRENWGPLAKAKKG